MQWRLLTVKQFVSYSEVTHEKCRAVFSRSIVACFYCFDDVTIFLEKAAIPSVLLAIVLLNTRKLGYRAYVGCGYENRNWTQLFSSLMVCGYCSRRGSNLYSPMIKIINGPTEEFMGLCYCWTIIAPLLPLYVLQPESES